MPLGALGGIFFIDAFGGNFFETPKDFKALKPLGRIAQYIKTN